MKPEDRYHRFVQWSDEDRCYIGYCPDVFYGGCCHGEREEEVYAELCAIVREEIAHRFSENGKLPKPTVRATRDLDFPEFTSTTAPQN
jgi:predicted RNase H-like HicB family nuclease